MGIWRAPHHPLGGSRCLRQRSPEREPAALFFEATKNITHLRGYGRGDQLVRVTVETPARLTSEQKKALREFAALSGEEVHPARKSFLEKVRELCD